MLDKEDFANIYCISLVEQYIDLIQKYDLLNDNNVSANDAFKLIFNRGYNSIQNSNTFDKMTENYIASMHEMLLFFKNSDVRTDEVVATIPPIVDYDKAKTQHIMEKFKRSQNPFNVLNKFIE